MASDPPRSILILKPSSFGDIIHTLPAVARLKASWPAARFHWLINPEWSPLLDGNPDLDGIVPFPRREFCGWQGPIKFLAWHRKQVRAVHPDLVLDFQGLLRTAIIGRLATPAHFFGMADAREGARWFYDRHAPMPQGVPHAVERYLALADFAVHQSDVSRSSPGEIQFPLPFGEPLAGSTAANLSPSFVLLHPFSRGEGKSLTTAQIQKLCARLMPRQVVIVGRRPDGVGTMPASSLDLLDRTMLSQLIWTISQAAFVISVDSGPAHLAAALGRPMVAIHTWSDPRRVGPYRSDAWVWKNGRLLQMRALPTMPPDFYRTEPHVLSASGIEAICALATSRADSCA